MVTSIHSQNKKNKMKRLLLIPVVLISMAAHALPNGWVVTVFNQAYVDLISPTVAPLMPGWDDPDVTIPLGFTHTFDGKSTNTLYIDGSNFSSGMDITTSLTGNVNVFSVGFLDVMDRATYATNPPSTISYLIDGSGSNKIAKIQWKDFGFYGENATDGTLNDSANIQMWFYQTDNAVEYRFGTSYLDDFERNVESTRLPLGIITNLDPAGFTLDKFFYLSSLSPAVLDSFTIANPPTVDFGIPTFPTNGTVIRFGPAAAVGVNNAVKLNDELTFYPSLVTSYANLDFTNVVKGDAMIRVLDMNGRAVMQQKVKSQKNQLDMSRLATSNYILQVQYQGQSVFYQFTKN